MPTPSTLPASAASGVATSAAMIVATLEAVRMVTSRLDEDDLTTHGCTGMFQGTADCVDSHCQAMTFPSRRRGPFAEAQLNLCLVTGRATATWGGRRQAVSRCAACCWTATE